MPTISKTKYHLLPAHRYSWRRLAWQAKIASLKANDWPILVGPWRGEIGFECLYWIPFLDHLKDLGIAKERMVPITRGGAGVWYDTPTALEIYAMRTPQQVRIENRVHITQTGLHKQETVTPFDRSLIRDAADTLNLTRYHVLHPAWMYHILAPFWTGDCGTEWLAPRVAFRTLMPPPLPEGVVLPDQFLAVRFYARETFQNHPKLMRPFLQSITEQMVGSLPIVILDSPFHLDDHIDLTLGCEGDRVTHLSQLVPNLTPENNLAVMSAILGRAQGFVGTYGGFAQLALRHARPSVTFYTKWGGTSLAHKSLSDTLALRLGVSTYVINVGDIPILSSLLPIAEPIPPRGGKLDTREAQHVVA